MSDQAMSPCIHEFHDPPSWSPLSAKGARITAVHLNNVMGRSGLHSHQRHVQDLASRLAAHPFLQQDELLTVLKGSPWTAAFAEARQRELLESRANAAKRDNLQQQVRDMAVRMEKMAQTSEHMGAAQIKAEADAAAAARLASAAKAASDARIADVEKSRDYYKGLLETRSQEARGLEEALASQAAEWSKQGANSAAREQDLARGQAEARRALICIREELSGAQSALQEEQARCSRLQSSYASAQQGLGAASADIRQLESALAEADAERSDARTRYLRLGDKVEALLQAEATARSSAERDRGAARLAVQEAARDVEHMMGERHELQKQLGSGRKAHRKATKRLEAAEHEAATLGAELADASRQIAALRSQTEDLTAQGRTWREQAEASQKEVAACKQQLHEKLSSREQMKADCKRDAEEHVRLTIREQEIEYERKIQDLESANKRLLASDLIVRPDDFIARTEHTRLLETALAMKQAELNREVERRLSQQERDARFALDSKETEMRKTSASHVHQVEEEHAAEVKQLTEKLSHVAGESRRLQLQNEELQQSAEHYQHETVRLKAPCYSGSSAEHCQTEDKLERQVTDLQARADEAEATLAEQRISDASAIAASDSQHAALVSSMQERERQRADELKAARRAMQDLEDTHQAELLSLNAQAVMKGTLDLLAGPSGIAAERAALQSQSESIFNGACQRLHSQAVSKQQQEAQAALLGPIRQALQGSDPTASSLIQSRPSFLERLPSRRGSTAALVRMPFSSSSRQGSVARPAEPPGLAEVLQIAQQICELVRTRSTLEADVSRLREEAIAAAEAARTAAVEPLRADLENLKAELSGLQGQFLVEIEETRNAEAEKMASSEAAIQGRLRDAQRVIAQLQSTTTSLQEQLESEIGRRQALAEEMQHIQRDTSIASGLDVSTRRRGTDDGPTTLEHLKSRLQEYV
ncbi:hypothetical protein WJX84_006054 [Apatococcus fuscideae]|uniref:Uncharacterized protein n=1 Tax=Apatococcus fuscideae TaxID=2026836 RepID=A0AAW1TKA2_9CHLO